MNSREEIERLCNENIKLVAYVMGKEFRVFNEIYPSLQEDLYQEGCIGLFDAARRYDSEKGTFANFAHFHIKNKMIKFYTRYVKKHYREDELSINKENYVATDDLVTLEALLESQELNQLDYMLEKEYVHETLEHIKSLEIKNIVQIVELRLKGYSQAKIGAIVGERQVYISRRLEKLKKELKKVS